MGDKSFRESLDPKYYGYGHYDRRQNSIQMDVRYNTRNTNARNMNTRNNSHKGRKIKKAKFRKLSTKVAAFALAGILLGGVTSCAVNNIKEEKIEKNLKIGYDITEQMEEKAAQELLKAKPTYNPETGLYELNFQAEPDRPNLAKLLYSTDSDDKLNKYYSNQEQGELDLSVAEINDLNFEMLKAIIADGSDIDSDCIEIQYVGNSMTETVRVQIEEQGQRQEFESYSGMGNSNFSQIDKELSKLIKTSCQYKGVGEVSLEDALDLYGDIKLFANYFEIVQDGDRLVFENIETGERFIHNSNGKLTKIEPTQQIEDEGR